MIERKFVNQKIKEFEVQEYLIQNLNNVGYSHAKMIKTPIGEKIIIYASRPGLVVGRKGQNIKMLTATLKKRFEFENPQIEISEVEIPNLDAHIVAARIVDSLERFGLDKFKAIGHKVMGDVMSAGALGIEIIISGKVPSDRAKSWRFYRGYLKKCGDTALTGVKRANLQAHLKTGVIGIKVSLMPPDTKLYDKITIGPKTDSVENAQKKEATEAPPIEKTQIKEGASVEKQTQKKAKRRRNEGKRDKGNE